MAPTFTPFAGLFRGRDALRAALRKLLEQAPSPSDRVREVL